MENFDRIFNYEALSKQYNIRREILGQLIDEIRKEFPDDEMLFELHVIRALEWLHEQNKH